MTSLAIDDFIGSPLYVQQALDGLQLRINSAKHMEAGIATLDSKFFQDKCDVIRTAKATYFADPSKENAIVIYDLCQETRRLL